MFDIMHIRIKHTVQWEKMMNGDNEFWINGTNTSDHILSDQTTFAYLGGKIKSLL